MKRNSHTKQDDLSEDVYDEFRDVNAQKMKRQKNMNRRKTNPYDRDDYDDWN
jgi:hypothetical protein